MRRVCWAVAAAVLVAASGVHAAVLQEAAATVAAAQGFSLQLADTKESLLTGKAVKSASVINDVIGRPALLIEFTAQGAEQLAAVARLHPKASVVVLVGGKPAAAALTLTQGSSGQLIVREVGDSDQAEALAKTLNTGAQSAN